MLGLYKSILKSMFKGIGITLESMKGLIGGKVLSDPTSMTLLVILGAHKRSVCKTFQNTCRTRRTFHMFYRSIEVHKRI